MSLIEQIKRQHVQPQRETIHVLEWGCTLEVCELDVEGVQEYLDVTQGSGKRERIVKLVAAAAFDPGTGQRAFSPADIEDLLRMPASPVIRVWAVARRLNSFLFADDGEPEKTASTGL